MSYIVIPNIFVSGVVSRAADVNSNFNVIASGLSNGDKDINVSSITATNITTTNLTATNQNFTNIDVSGAVIASGGFIASNGLHEAKFHIDGLSGVIKVDEEWAASFRPTTLTVPAITSNGTGTFGSNVVVTSGADVYVKVEQVGESTGDARLTPYSVGSYQADDFSLKTNDVIRAKLNGYTGYMSVGGNFNALSPLHVSGNIRASGAIINGYTQLGGGAPAIKTLLITGTLPASGESQNYSIAPITTTHQIVSVSILASGDYAYQASTWNPPFRSGATVNYEYTLLSQPDFGVQVLQIRMGANADTIELNPFKAFITYVA